MCSESLLTLSRPYAEAVFEFACQHKSLEKWELMLVCAKRIICHPMVAWLLSIVDCIEPTELADMFIAISRHEFDCFGQNFIRVLSDYKKLYLIPNIFDEFLSLRKQTEGTLKIEIVTSILLSNDEILQIIFLIKRRFLYNIDAIYKVDPSIIGGIILRINNFVIDGSVRGRIEYFKRILKIEERSNGIKCC